MYSAKCKKCGEILGAIRDPSRFTWLQCLNCGFQNNIMWVIDPNENFDHPDDRRSMEREKDLHANANKNIKDARIVR